MNTKIVIPKGCMLRADGVFVPNSLVSAIDVQRNETVLELIECALVVQKAIKNFKKLCMDDLQAFVELSAEEYGANIGGNKGNITLISFDGRYKITRSIADFITFDERLQVAKELIDKCINRWSESSRPEIKVLVQDAFQTDKQGKINTTRVLGLRRLDIKDEEWKQAMAAISDSVTVTGSKTYVRFYERVGSSDQYVPISLDIAAV